MKLRLPPELKAAIEEAAEDEKRTLNSEILRRLYVSFDYEEEKPELLAKITHLEAQNAALDAKIEESAKLKAVLEQERLNNVRTSADWQEWATQQFTDENTIYVLLDADGNPQSWDEIMTHLRAIADAVDGDIERIDAAVIDPVKVSNSKRVEQWMKLREFYRAKFQKRG